MKGSNKVMIIYEVSTYRHYSPADKDISIIF